MRVVPQLSAGLVAASVLLAAAPAAAEPLEVAIFDPVYEKFQMPPNNTKEVEQHFREWLAKPNTIKPMDRGRRDRDLLDNRVFVPSQVGRAEAEQVCRQVGWQRFLVSRLTGLPNRRIELVVTYVDLSLGDAGVIEEKRTVANHLKPIRNALRELGQKVAAQVKPLAAEPPAAEKPPAKP